MPQTQMTLAPSNAPVNETVSSTPVSQAKSKNTLWWEAPLDEFTEMLQELHAQYPLYFSRYEMEQVYNEVCQYTYQRGKLWEEQVTLGISAEYLQYLADDLVGYLRHIYQFLKEDVLDRKNGPTMTHKPLVNEVQEESATASAVMQ